MARNHKIDAKALLAIVRLRGPDFPVTRGEAAALVTELADTPDRDVYEFRKRIATKMDRASMQSTSRARTPRLSRQHDGSVRVGDVVKWAEAVLGRTFADLPHDPPRSVLLAGTGRVSVSSGNAGAQVLPGSLSQCHELILSLYAEVDRLGMETQRLGSDLRAKFHQNFKKKK